MVRSNDLLCLFCQWRNLLKVFPASRWQGWNLNQLVQLQAFTLNHRMVLPPPCGEDKGKCSRPRCSGRFFHTTANFEIKDGWSNESNVPWSLGLCWWCCLKRMICSEHTSNLQDGKSLSRISAPLSSKERNLCGASRGVLSRTWPIKWKTSMLSQSRETWTKIRLFPALETHALNL